MNTSISRIAAAAPVAVALVGFGVGSAHAAPYDPSSADKAQVQPADQPPVFDPGLPITDDLPDGDPPVDPEDVGPADPADEPDEPDEDDGNDEESDEDAEDFNESNNGGKSSAGGSQGGSGGAEDSDKDEASDAAEPAGGTSRLRGKVEAADVQVTPVSTAGVQVPLGLVASAGVALAAVFGWAAYRRAKAFASA